MRAAAKNTRSSKRRKTTEEMEYFSPMELQRACPNFGISVCKCKYCKKYEASCGPVEIENIICHGFDLTEDLQIPEPVLAEMMGDRRVLNAPRANKFPEQWRQQLLRRTRVLTSSEEAKARAVLATPATSVVAEIDNAIITGRDMRCLVEGKWLNDEIVNGYIALLKQNLPDTVFIASSFLFERYGGRKYDAVQVGRWFKRAKVSMLEKVYLPIHGPGHWSLAVIDIVHRRLEYFDSLGHPNQAAMKLMRQITSDILHDDGQWAEYRPNHNIPKQENGVDCGVFMLMYIGYSVDNLPFSFTQEHMGRFRSRIALAISNKCIE
jgi:Ulp1 family protease